MEKYKLPKEDKQFTENWSYFEGDQFKYWVGAFPSYDHPNRDLLIEQLRKTFICANLIKETTLRHVDALISEFPDITAKPRSSRSETEEEPTETTDPTAIQAEKMIHEWLETLLTMTTTDTDDDISPIHKAIIKMCVAGRGYLRLFSRKRFERSPNLSQRVSLHCPDNGQIINIYDDEGSLEAIEYLFDNGRIERQELDPVTGILTITIYENREAQMKGEPSTDDPPYDLDLNFNWSIFSISAPPIITNSVKSLQNSINLVLTMLGRNVVTAGFLERLLLNAQSPGEFVEDMTGDRRFVPDPAGFATGAGAVSFVRGLPIGDDPMNPEGYTNPSAVFREPVDVTSFEKSLDIFIRRLYQEVGQGHILTQGDGSISGVSRIQLAQDFRSTIRRHTQAIESIMNNVLYAAVMMLSHLQGDHQQFKSVVITTKLRLTDHLATPEEIKEVRDNFAAGIISHVTTLGLMGIDDIEQELEYIAEEKQTKMDELEDTLEIESSFATPTNQQPPKK